MPPHHPAPPRPDILHLAQDNLGTADQVIVYGWLFDAAIRSTWTMALTDARRTALLCEAVDRLCDELNRTKPAQVTHAPVIDHPHAAGLKVAHPRPPRP